MLCRFLVSGLTAVAALLTITTGFVLPSHHRLLGDCGGQYSHAIIFSASDENNDTIKKHSRYRDAMAVVVGKVILDKYGDPSKVSQYMCNDDKNIDVTIGGGGPQAAWGACASLAARDMLAQEEETWTPMMKDILDNDLPPKQRVIFLAPIGLENWTPEMTQSINSLLPMLEVPPILVTSKDHITPTINIWHDEHEIVQWMPVDGSFGEKGAGGLWKNRPSSDDILHAIKNYRDIDNIMLHAILEAGHNAAGNGDDALLFFDHSLMKLLSMGSIEPIVFPDESGKVSLKDAKSARTFIQRLEICRASSWKPLPQYEQQASTKLLVIPDLPCYDALLIDSNSDMKSQHKTEYAVRDGANGSFVDEFSIPAAKLNTCDGKPLNPTGAGNAYSGAYAVCRSSGSSAVEAACLANAVGAVVCEYTHLPPWTWEVLERVVEAACEIKSNVKAR